MIEDAKNQRQTDAPSQTAAAVGVGVAAYLSVAEAASALGVNRSALYQAIQAGHLNPVRVMGKQALRIADVEAYQPRQYSRRKSL